MALAALAAAVAEPIGSQRLVCCFGFPECNVEGYRRANQQDESDGMNK